MKRPDLELLVRVRRPLHVLLQAVVLVRLDHRDPREVLDPDLGHLLVGLARNFSSSEKRAALPSSSNSGWRQ